MDPQKAVFSQDVCHSRADPNPFFSVSKLNSMEGNRVGFSLFPQPAPAEENCAGPSKLEMAVVTAVLLAATAAGFQPSAKTDSESAETAPDSAVSFSEPEFQSPESIPESGSLEHILECMSLSSQSASFLAGSYGIMDPHPPQAIRIEVFLNFSFYGHFGAPCVLGTFVNFFLVRYMTA